MISSADLKLVDAIAKGGSLRMAARELGVTSSAISQKLAKLEERLKIQLAQRSGRAGLVLTAEGGWLAEQAGDILNRLKGLEADLSDRKGVVAGVLSVLAPFGFGRSDLAPLVAEFCALYPKLDVHLEFMDNVATDKRLECDIVFRLGRPVSHAGQEATLITHERRVLCAAPSYILEKGVPRSPRDLNSLNTIAINEDSEDPRLWSFQKTQVHTERIRIKPRLTSNDGEVARSWALAGHGIVMRPLRSVEEDLEAGRLVKVLSDWTVPDVPVVALTRSGVTKPIRIHRFLSFLKEKFVTSSLDKNGSRENI